MSVMTAGFHGRTTELDTLRSVVEAAATGRGGIVLIHGEAGLGKSRLLAETTSAATRTGVEVASGSARQLERDRPFGALIDALDLKASSPNPTRTELLGLLDTADTGSDLRFRIAELIVDVIEAGSLHAPLLLALEDLHWSDPSTLMVLDRLVGLVPSLPVALILTFRPTPRPEELSAVIASATASDATEIALTPLDDDAVQALVSSLLGADVGANLERGVKGAGGNPLFVTELVAALDQEGLLTRSHGTADATGAALPPSLRLTILRRLAFLPGDCLKILKVASVLGSSFSLHDLSIANTQTPLDLFELLEPALASGLVIEAAEALSFKHDLVRDAVYYDLPESARRSFHREIAAKLAAAGAPAQQVAAHMSLGASEGDAEAVSWLRRAATEAGARAPTITVELLERALELAAADDPDRDAIEIELVEG
ncbi:MAG: AAA family ATPase, partial [Actinomycetota bacterium]|nr:AAA family ATPase [Actinomycetota bacterium]